MGPQANFVNDRFLTVTLSLRDKVRKAAQGLCLVNLCKSHGRLHKATGIDPW